MTNSIVLVSMCPLSVCSLHYVYMVFLTFPQGDIGTTGPPGIPGPPVSEIFFFPQLFTRHIPPWSIICVV